MNSEKNSKTWLFIWIAVIIIIAVWFLHSPHQRSKEPSNMLGKPSPSFSLPSLLDSPTLLTDQSLQGHVFLLNFWASWCPACRAEHSTLLMIANTYHVPIYGIAYKDNSQNAKDRLKNAGNPYVLIARDTMGSLTMPLELYGTPETFIVDKHGMIRHVYLGAISQNDWETSLRPLVEQYEKEN